jgi:glycosyltransferase involved in cell wall biosynthesis
MDRLSVIAATYPLTSGAAHFNAAMVGAMRTRSEVDLISWRRLYPPLLYRGQAVDSQSRPPRVEPAVFLLDWLDPRTWRAAVERIARFRPSALVLPWLHPVSALPYRFLLRHAAAGVRRVVICHNVVTHERVPAGAALTRATLRHADLLVTHAPQQRHELAELGLGKVPTLESFHPCFEARDLAVLPSAEEIRAERARFGDPDLLLCCFGAVRPYKGFDVAIEAIARVDPALSVRLVVAGRFWEGRDELEEQVRRLGLEGRVELRDGYVSNEEAALLFESADAALLPYRSASQSGVAALAFAHGRPVIATRVGGLPDAVRAGKDGLLCPPEDPDALARTIERFAATRTTLTSGVLERRGERSFARYAELLNDALSRQAAA